MDKANRLLAHPLVLSSAWERLCEWYRYGDTPPEPEFSAWRMDPDGHLEALAQSLVNGAYSPSPFPLIPYPKKGSTLRHYCRPSIRDQLVFTAFGVLLAPWLEAAMPNLSFGNRWYRGIYFKPLGGRNLWVDRPFALEDRQIYQPYRRAHGLFRRVAHWTAQAMVGERPTGDSRSAAGQRILVQDYPEKALPGFVRPQWWASARNAKSPVLGYWAEIDLQLAYPSVSVALLRQQMPRLLAFDSLGSSSSAAVTSAWPSRSSDGDDKPRPTVDYPSDIQKALDDPEVRRALADTLCDLLEEVRYAPTGAPGDPWRPPHTTQTLPLGDGAGHPGLPTGLVLSGLLLNVYLEPLDRYMKRWCNPEVSGQPAGFLRFADDLRLFALSEQHLLAGIDAVWAGICRQDPPDDQNRQAANQVACLAAPQRHNPTNLRVNWAKVGPEPVARIVKEYLIDHRWQTCTGCDHLFYLGDPDGPGPLTLADWWAQHPNDAHRQDLRRAALMPGHLDAFVTHLVERMSELGGDSLLDRFGDLARQRLTQLHQLIRFDIDDRQVRLDTRLAFGAGHLVRAWLPEDSRDEDRALIAEMRESVGRALRRAPWKFTLWRAVLKAAARRPCAPQDSGSQDQANDRRDAEDWLEGLLRQIRVLDWQTSTDDHSTWHHLWPEQALSPAAVDRCWEFHERQTGAPQGDRPPTGGWKAQSLSAHRAAFWFALGQTLQDLDQALHAGVPGAPEEVSAPWSSGQWTFRALPRDALQPTLDWLANLDRWCNILYPSDMGELFSSHTSHGISLLEREALALASLKALDPAQVIARLALAAGDRSAAASPTATGAAEATGGDATAAAAGAPTRSPLQPKGKPNVPGMAAWVLRQTRPRQQERVFTLIWPGVLTPGAGSYPPPELIRLLRPLPMDQRPGLLDCWPSPAAPGAAGPVELSPFSHMQRLGLLRCFPPHEGPVIERLAKDRLAGLEARIQAPQPDPGNLWYLRQYATVRRALLSYNRPVNPKNRGGQVTLHRLLWGNAWDASHSGLWRIVPAQATQLGLPIRIAVRMLLDVLPGDGETDSPIGLPPVWVLTDGERQRSRQWLTTGRRCQLGYDDWQRFYTLPCPVAGAPRRKAALVNTGGYACWELLPHPLYLWPGLLPSALLPADYRHWCHLLQFLTAVEGSEAILDALFQYGAGTIPFEERWHWRHRVHMPRPFWEYFEHLCRLAMGRASPLADLDTRVLGRRLQDTLRTISEAPLSPRDFRWERVDIQLKYQDPWDLPVSVTPYPTPEGTRLGDGGTRADIAGSSTSGLADHFRVRIGQVNARPDWDTFVATFPHLQRDSIQRIMRQVWGVFLAEHRQDGATQPGPDGELILLPEATIPRSEIRQLQRLAAETGRAVLAGCLWRVLPPVAVPHRAISAGPRYLANEAILAAPLNRSEADRLPAVRLFTVQKPIPAHSEEALAVALTLHDKRKNTWRMLPGSRWYRFAHPRWGCFTVAICSDLLDPVPWASLRGQIQHILTCAYNQDVDLYDAMTWVRAYENYTNVVLTNHGEFGGSFAWTPRGQHRKEITRLRGADLYLIADVKLPVTGLVEAQRHGAQRSVAVHVKEWLDGAPKGEKKQDYKAPPRGFEPRPCDH